MTIPAVPPARRLSAIVLPATTRSPSPPSWTGVRRPRSPTTSTRWGTVTREPQAAKAGFLYAQGDTSMTRDWVLTLLAISPLVLAGVIVILALIRKPAPNESDSPTAQASARHD